MANERSARYRTDDPYDRTAAAGGSQGGDPLAELARLIGQSDPFSEFGRESRPPASPDQRFSLPTEPHYGQEHGHQHGHEPAPHFEPALTYASEPASHYGNEAAPHYGAEQHYAAEPAPQYGHEPAAPEDWQAAAPAPAYDPLASPVHQAPLASGQHYDVQGYAVPGFASQSHAARHQDAHSHDHDLHAHEQDPHQPQATAEYHTGYDAPGLVQAAPEGQDTPDFPTTPPPFHRGDRQPPTDDFYDDAPQGGRRKGLVTVLAVLCLAVLGTAGAFGYRSIFGGSGSTSAPPVIRASAEPSKVAPPPASGDASINKMSYDRFGDRGQNEQVLVREEQPLDPKDVVRSSPPRVVLPGGLVGNQAVAATGAANPPSVLTEPKRVRTVPIRPDQPDNGAAGVAGRAQSVAPAALPAPRQLAAAAPANAPLDVSPQASAQPLAPPPPRVVAPRPVQQAPQPAAANAPLSLSPDAGSMQASLAPARSAPAPVRASAATASNGNGGGYHVQVSSQRSEADAQTSFRSLQSKYGSVLGDRQPVIRRADLGAKGTYYRAMVGPFSSRDQAVQLCGSLKAAGGDCVVQSH